jgi:hypothetical protein
MPLTNLLHFSHREEPMRLSRSGFETIPSDLSKAELFRYFTYSARDDWLWPRNSPFMLTFDKAGNILSFVDCRGGI